jgi:addiction module HigA family antidote
MASFQMSMGRPWMSTKGEGALGGLRAMGELVSEGRACAVAPMTTEIPARNSPLARVLRLAGRYGVQRPDRGPSLTDEHRMTTELPEGIHPSEVLLEDFMQATNIPARQRAADIDGPPSRISDIVSDRRPISADTAVRLGVFFGMDARFWVNLQAE